MRSLTDLPPDLVDFAAAAQRSLEAGDFAGASDRLAECLAAFHSKTRILDDVQAYRDWLNGCLSLAHIGRKHLSHKLIQLQQGSYGRVGTTPLWSVQG